MADDFSNTYNGFSGVDMIVTFGGQWVGELQGLSYSVTREKVPIYTMGHANPRAFSRGKRGIAGALVFAVFDRSALLAHMNALEGGHVSPLAGGDQLQDGTVGYKYWKKTAGTVNGTLDARLTVNQVDNQYFDQILPFNVVVSAANEYGVRTGMEIRGVELMNNGAGVSIDDITTDETCSFLAREIVHWKPSGTTTDGYPTDLSLVAPETVA